MDKTNMEQVSFEELWAKLSGSTNFGQDELIEMLSVQDDAEKDFYIYHRNSAFCVPLHKIREFFTRHKKPIPPMTQDQEVKYLREKVQKLESEVEAHVGQDAIAKPAPDNVTEVHDLPPEEDTKVAEEEAVPPVDTGSNDAPVGEEPELLPVIESNVPVTKEKIIPPKRDEGIPPAHERKKMTLKETRAMLAEELKNKPLPKAKVTDSSVAKNIKDREGEVDQLLKKK